LQELKYDLLVDGIFVFHSDEVKKQYPPQKGIDERPEASVLGTDYTFVCPTRNATDNFLNTSELVWLYLFDHPLSFGWGKDFAYCNNYSCESCLGGSASYNRALILQCSEGSKIVEYLDLSAIELSLGIWFCEVQRMLEW
jgi:hypothetical protein